MLNDDLTPIPRLGRLALTPGARKSLSEADVLNALLRHAKSGATPARNSPAIDALNGCPILTVFRSSAGRAVLIITDADRALTRILMPEEY